MTMADDRIYMLNALWFRPDGGAATYARYAAAAGPFVAELGGRLLDGYVPEAELIGSWKPDVFFVVEWPNLQQFASLAAHPGYQQIAHLRDEAISDSLLIRCARMTALSD